MHYLHVIILLDLQFCKQLNMSNQKASNNFPVCSQLYTNINSLNAGILLYSYVSSVYWKIMLETMALIKLQLNKKLCCFKPFILKKITFDIFLGPVACQRVAMLPSGVGVTKALPVNISIFVHVKAHVRVFKSHPYLADVTAAKLR